MNVLAALKQQVTCAVCFDVFKTPTLITKCLHVFCEVCIKDNRLGDRCPECRMPFAAVELKFSHRDESLIDIYKSAKNQVKKEMAKEKEVNQGDIFTKMLCKLVDTISVEDAEILFKILHKEPLPRQVKLLEMKAHAVDQIERALLGTNQFNEEDGRFLYQTVLDLSEGDCSMEQIISLYQCLRLQKKWVTPLDILQKARKIALAKNDSILLACSFNHPEETYASVEKAADALNLRWGVTEHASFFLRILSLPNAKEELRSQAATKYFSFQWTQYSDEAMLRQLLFFSDLSMPLLTQCIKGCVPQALSRNDHVYRTLCLWLVTSPQDKSIEMLKREVIDSLVENLEKTQNSFYAGILFSDLLILDMRNPTVVYLFEKYLNLLHKTQYSETIYLPISKTASNYSAPELKFFYLMVNAIEDEKLPLQTAYLYIPRLLSYYQSTAFRGKLPSNYSTAQQLINSLPKHLKEYAIEINNKSLKD